MNQPAEETAESPLVAVQADEALLDTLGGPDPDLSEHADHELASLLLSWRKEADGQPIAELVDTDLALAVIAASRLRRW